MWHSPWSAELGLDFPLIQAPMAGANDAALASAVSRAGALGSIPCATLSPERVAQEVAAFRRDGGGALNLNFFCHRPPAPDASRERGWRDALTPYYREAGLADAEAAPGLQRRPFDADQCRLVEALRPAVVSFHFGLPDSALLDRVKASGAKVLASATTVAEGRWLEARGVDIVIAQGWEAGGHRGHFLADDVIGSVSTHPATFALVPQLVDAVALPVIAAGGIADRRGIEAARALGASGVQLGTAYLLTPQSTIGELHRQALRQARDDSTAVTNLFSGRPARGIVNRLMRELGPLSDHPAPFPNAGQALAPLKQHFEALGSSDFSSLWAGQAVTLCQEIDAETLTRQWISAQ